MAFIWTESCPWSIYCQATGRRRGPHHVGAAEAAGARDLLHALRAALELAAHRLDADLPRQHTVYAATKTRSFTKELGARNIRVNSLNPGLAHSAVSQSKDAVASVTPLGRIGRPDEIAPAAVYLASDESSWVTGETHYIAGGLHG